MSSIPVGAYGIAYTLTNNYIHHLIQFICHPLLVYYDVLLPLIESPVEYLQNWFIREHPFTLSLHVLVAFIFGTFTLSTVSDNYSIVDRIWSIAPFLYAWIYVFRSLPYFDPRLFVIAIITTLWGLRLTYNFWRKGGYSYGHEDYRWSWLRSHIQKPYGILGNGLWQLFNLVFISGYQNILLWALISPICLEAWNVRTLPRGLLTKYNIVDVPWNSFDTMAFILCFGFLVFETIADNQQWEFQQEKYRLLEKAKEDTNRGAVGVSLSKPSVGLGVNAQDADVKSKVQSNLVPRVKEISLTSPASLNVPQYLNMLPFPYNLGFYSSGLFKYSRHPNFFAEISFWFCLHLFALSSVASSNVMSTKLNFPVPVSISIALTSDWTTLLLFTHRATRLLIVPLVRYSLLGAINLWLLFNGSTFVTERITMSKYPWYAEYCQLTSRWIPFYSGGQLSHLNESER